MNMRKIYRKVAKEYGVSVEEVKREMQAAITDAYTNPLNNNGIGAIPLPHGIPLLPASGISAARPVTAQITPLPM